MILSRTKAVTMLVGSSVFVLVGAIMVVHSPAARPMGLATIALFGACAAVGVFALRGPENVPLGPGPGMGIASIAMGLGCLLLGPLAGGAATSTRQPPMVILAVGLIGAVFFIGGGVLMLLRTGRRKNHERPRRPPATDPRPDEFR